MDALRCQDILKHRCFLQSRPTITGASVVDCNTSSACSIIMVTRRHHSKPRKSHEIWRHFECLPQNSDISRTRSLNWNDARLVLQLSLPNALMPGDKPWMKMKLEQRRQAMLQLHLIDQHIYCILSCPLYERSDGIVETTIRCWLSIPPARRSFWIFDMHQSCWHSATRYAHTDIYISFSALPLCVLL